MEDEEPKQCLLHCALYPEDFEINKQELIEHLIDDGIIERMKNRQAGYSILSKMENACLLEGGNDNFVRMHDLVRDMVLQVASPEFMVEGQLGLEDFSDEGKWREDLVKASLMYKDISTIPSSVSPRCPNLSTLLLQGNKSLKNVPDSLFEHLHRLKVLDLSDTAIESLPNSVFSLENLTTLRLRWCENLKQVPSLAKLTALRKLDLEGTGITEVPDGLEMLVNLKFLNLNASELKVMPLGILPKMSHLQYLIVYWNSMATVVNEEEMASLKELEAFAGIFDDADKFSMYIRSLENRRLACYQIRAGKWGEAYRRLPYRLVGKGVNIIGCNLRRGDESFVLPKDVQSLDIAVCRDLKSLCDVPSLNHTSELQRIHLSHCGGIEHVLSFSSSCTLSLLQTLENLVLVWLDNLRVLFWKEKAASAWIPSDTFFCLKIIHLYQCSKIKKLFPLGLLLHLHYLEDIRVEYCEQLEEIIGEASDEFEEEKEEEEGMDTTKITLPNLRVLKLRYLPGLKTICSSSKVIVCDSIEGIQIYHCPKVKRLPLSLPRLSNGQLSPPPSLEYIEIYSSGGIWWESMEWDCPDTKNVLQPFFGFP